MSETSSKKLIAFNYFGGKYSHLNFILKRLPQTKSFVDVFGGSGVVILNKKPVKIETYNDLDSTVVNFFNILRNNSDELLEKIYLTPYSREEYWDCFKNINKGNEIERARRFFVTVNQSFNGSYSRQTGWKMSTKQVRTLTSEALNRWLSKIPNLEIIIERLRKIQISNYDFRAVFEKFDSPDTLFYCDPPYPHETRSNNNEYRFEMSTQDHIELLELVLNLKGKIAISGYDNELYNEKLKSFHKSMAKPKPAMLFHSFRQEVLWTNYNPDHIHSQGYLFHAIPRSN